MYNNKNNLISNKEIFINNSKHTNINLQYNEFK